MKPSSRYALALLTVAAGALGTAPSAHAVRMYTIDSAGGNALRSFDSSAPGTPLSEVAISGLGAGEIVAGLDVRPSTGELYAVTTGNRLYVLNPVTAAATAVGPGPFSPAWTSIRLSIASGSSTPAASACA
jgi:Domain of unknown function (DUF4394)